MTHARIGELLVRSLGERWGIFRAQLERNRRRCSEPGIHDLRVATRRLLAILDVVAPFVEDSSPARLRRVLRRLLRSFNDLRDTQVQLMALRGMTRRFSAARGYRIALKTREVRLVREAGTMIRNVPADRLHRFLVGVQSEFQSVLSQPGMPDAVAAAVRGIAALAYARVVRRRWAVTPADVRSIHRLRVAFKKLRYTLEVLQPVFPGVTRGTLRVMNNYQTLMGEVQDAEVMSVSIRRQSMRSRIEALRLVPLQQYWAEMKRRRIETFLQRADEVYRFWPGDEIGPGGRVGAERTSS